MLIMRGCQTAEDAIDKRSSLNDSTMNRWWTDAGKGERLPECAF